MKISKVRLQLVKEAGYTVNAIQITSPRDAAKLVMDVLTGTYGADTKESLWVIHLDIKNHVMGMEVISTGGANFSVISIAEVFRGALVGGAIQILIAHNHPSGKLDPSPEDIQLTAHIVEAGNLLGLPVLDHLIFSDSDYISLKERGLMK